MITTAAASSSYTGAAAHGPVVADGREATMAGAAEGRGAVAGRGVAATGEVMVTEEVVMEGVEVAGDVEAVEDEAVSLLVYRDLESVHRSFQ